METNLLPGKKCPRKILIAPNAFKGTLEATEFCRILNEELQSPHLLPISLPLCDGGDGTAAIIAMYLKAKPVIQDTVDALGRPHQVTYYIIQDTGIVDVASVCGLKDLLPHEYDVLNANTAGLGKVLLQMVRQGVRRILLGVGGSASIDGGCGALAEMGLKIVKRTNQYHNHIIEIEDINSDELKENFKDVKWDILCDVNHVLCGPEGAACIFGPQKGATPSQISMLDRRLLTYASLLLTETGKEVIYLKHGGAAGGIAAAFQALFNARLVSGADYCLQLSGFNEILPQAELVITGEGKLDQQSLQGKLSGVIADLCRCHHIPVWAIAGLAAPNTSFNQIYTLVDYAGNLPSSMRQPGYYLRLLAKDLKKDILKLI